MDLHEQRKAGLSFTKQAKYFITDSKFLKTLKVSSLPEVETRIADQGEGVSGNRHTPLRMPRGGFNEGTFFQNYYYEALKPFSEEALLAGFLMIYLKKCIVPAHSHEIVFPIVASYSAVDDSPSGSSISCHDVHPSVWPLSIGYWVHEGHGESSRRVLLHLSDGMTCAALSHAYAMHLGRACSFRIIVRGVELVPRLPLQYLDDESSGV